jgi:phytoene dehydrogenase-like protein
MVLLAGLGALFRGAIKFTIKVTFCGLKYGSIGIFVVGLVLVIYGLWDHYKKATPRVARAVGHTVTPKDERGFSVKKIPEDVDVIVIGSGMGGLTTAALLARRGKKVVLLEQHDKLGGCTHAFEENGFEFDTGLHYVGGEVGNRKSPLGFVFDLLSVGFLKWAQLDDCYDIAVLSPTLKAQNEPSKVSLQPAPGVYQGPPQPTPALVDEEDLNKNTRTRFHFTSNLETVKGQLIDLFPKQKKGIEDFYRLVGWANIGGGLHILLKVLPAVIGKIIRYTLGWLLLDPFVHTSTKEIIDSCFPNNEEASSLKGILGWCWGDYGAPPSLSPFFIHATLVDHFSKGAYYPIGGPSVIAESFIRIIEANGGCVCVRAPVKKICVDTSTHKVTGVTLVKAGSEHFIPCSTVVSAAGAYNTYGKLLSELSGQSSVVDKARSCFDYQSTTQERLERWQDRHHGHSAARTQLPVSSKLGPSCAMVTVFIGLDNISDMPSGNADFKVPSCNMWVYPHWNHDQGAVKYLHSVVPSSVLDTETEEYVHVSGNEGVEKPTDVTDFVDKMYIPVVFMGSASG